MTNEQILKKVIEKAVKNGWIGKVQWLMNPELYRDTIIFNHDFAKAFFPWVGNEKDKPWLDFVANMAREENKFKYLKKFI